ECVGGARWCGGSRFIPGAATRGTPSPRGRPGSRPTRASRSRRSRRARSSPPRSRSLRCRKQAASHVECARCGRSSIPPVPLYLTEADVEELLAPADAFAAVEASLGRRAGGEVDNRTRISLDLPDGKFAAMPCVDRGLGYAGLKTYAWAPADTPFLVVLFGLDGTLE